MDDLKVEVLFDNGVYYEVSYERRVKRASDDVSRCRRRRSSRRRRRRPSLVRLGSSLLPLSSPLFASPVHGY